MRASKVGFPCDRNLWYSVNDGYEEKVLEKSQRIFDVGTALEPVIIKWLEDDGWKIQFRQQEIYKEVRGGGILGHIDGMMSQNWWDGEIFLFDIKTMNERAFNFWKADGTLAKYPQYVDQLHCYASCNFSWKLSGLAVVGVNKNNSDLKIDYFKYDENRMTEIIERTERIFALEEPPEQGDRMQKWCCGYCGYSWLCDLCKKKGGEVNE